jgi:secernin
MCDTLCVLSAAGTLFAKNSDRPVSELQVVEVHRRRAAGASLRTQYLDIDDAGACATILSRPVWLWGAEHGINEHRVAIGNEMVHTVDDPRQSPPALLGMDLVRLGLERATDADQALAVIAELLERHGQGGVGDEANNLPYWSSFLVADPTTAWVLETSGRAWAARPVHGGDAISNRLTTRDDWTRASSGVVPGTDLDTWRDPAIDTGFADGRLAAGRAFVAQRLAATHREGTSTAARAAVAHLRDHGTGPWGAPGEVAVVRAPTEVAVDGTGVTVCMHVRDFEVTTASMVAELYSARDRPARAWMCVGSPCASVFVPTLAPDNSLNIGSGPSPTIGFLAQASWATRWAAVARAAERDIETLATARAVLSPVEAELWDEADTLGADPAGWQVFGTRAERQLASALDHLALSGIGIAR